MDEERLAERFEADRDRLRAVAHRMLGSGSEAEDAVQEAWLRLARSDAAAVENLSGWLTTVVARVCLDQLRSRAARREEPLEDVPRDGGAEPEDEAVLGDAVGAALLVVLDTLTPAERLAFVLHDLFAVPFDEIATILGRSPTAARQLASRARRRLQGAEVRDNVARRRAVVDAFLAAARGGNFAALLALLDPDVSLRADAAAVRMGAAAEARGAEAVATTFAGRAKAARPATVDALPGLVWMQAGQPRIVFAFTIVDGRITRIDLLADLEAVDLAIDGADR